ncbi:hypothetical protein HYFRA_00003491 [Hymenoscyphus fraxineus]|uniref:Uncharacterized protein n=1 Tax=Hymenoscyphus fraxineus TaxID=746836 RepID=A0A9N9PHN1_9HELO|nr:hypothetical protein HYFRA_00003491 [Hymenoscyphus fraxineus]
MRASTVGWVCTAGLAAANTRGKLAPSSNTNDDQEVLIVPNLGHSVQKIAELAQNVIVTVFASESIEIAVGHENENTNDALESKQHLQIVTRTSEFAVTSAHPKITPGPSLFRRKLGSNKWALIHEGIQGQKRDATQCPVDYQLCPKSLNGGCCPNDRVCGASSCLPTSAAPASACGISGYIACGASDGGGCCPGGFVCGQAGCSPSAGVSASQTCGANSYQCAASFGGGCCKNGMGCAVSTCYVTSISTFTLLETITTTDASSNPVTRINTKITATTPVTPTATVPSNENLVTKLPSSAPVAKTEATSASKSDSTGLTTPTIGGIIGGAIGFLVIILIIATFIIRRLNKVVKVTEATNSRTSSSGPRSGRSRPRAPSNQMIEVDQLSVDPLMMTPSESSGIVRRPSNQSSSIYSAAHEVEANSPRPLFNTYSPFSPQPPSHTHYPGGYNPVSTSDSPNSQNYYRHDREPSLEPSPPTSVNPNGGYFDLPIQSNRGSQGSIFTRRPSTHGRNWSNSSDQSNVSQMSDPVELEASLDDGRRSSLSRALYGLGMGGMSRIVSRKLSGGSGSSSSATVQRAQSKRTPAWQTPASPTALGHIAEASESQYHVDDIQSAPMRQQGLSGSQLREAGMSNSQLREMTLFEANPYTDPNAPPKPRPAPKDYDDEGGGGGKHMTYG